MMATSLHTDLLFLREDVLCFSGVAWYMVVRFGDTYNAFQQSPPPERQCYLEIDNAYESWYHKRHGGRRIDRRKYVIPVNRALQGQPSVLVQWTTMINKILINELGFKNTPHEQNLYCGVVDGHDIILVCRQVDDYAVACENKVASGKLIKLIDERV
jgi:hypothetical protein